MNKTVVKQTKDSISFSRIFDAPRELVFSMFKEPRHLMQWWGPKLFPMVECTVDFRPQGSWRFVLRGPSGEKVDVHATYQEIVEPERIVFTDNIVKSAVTNISFADKGAQTLVTSTITYSNPDDFKMATEHGIVAGIQETWDQLAQLVERQ